MKNNLKSSIIRVQKNKDNPYLMLNKECINDDRLSWAAKGLHTYLLGLPDNWKIYVSELIKHTSSGETNTRSAIKELLTYGYMERFQYRCKGVVVSGEYVVHETPIKFDGDNTKTKIIKVERNNNGEYIEINTSEPYCENLNLDTPNSDFTPLINNNKINNNKINNNFDDEEATPEQQLINLYKSFKLEKRVMPQTLKMLKNNVHISLDIFEQLFINATSKDSTYRYLQEVLKDLNTNNITTLEEFNNHLDAKKGKGTKGSNKEKSKTNNNKFKNFTETFTNYSENELDKIINKSQKEKFEKDSNINVSIEDKSNNNDFEKIMYEKCINSNWNCVDTTKKYAIEYAKKNGLYYPENVKF